MEEEITLYGKLDKVTAGPKHIAAVVLIANTQENRIAIARAGERVRLVYIEGDYFEAVVDPNQLEIPS